MGSETSISIENEYFGVDDKNPDKPNLAVDAKDERQSPSKLPGSSSSFGTRTRMRGQRMFKKEALCKI